MAARVAGVTTATRCLTLGLSHQPAAITLAQNCGCSVTAVSRSAERVQIARDLAAQADVDALIRFEVRDPQRLAYPADSFDFIVAEAGALTNLFGSPDVGLTRILPFLRAGGALAVSDLVYTLSPPPDAVRNRFPHLWTERKYTSTLEAARLHILFGCWVARRGWRAFIAAAGETRDFWESRDARSGLACLYLVARKGS